MNHWWSNCSHYMTWNSAQAHSETLSQNSDKIGYRVGFHDTSRFGTWSCYPYTMFRLHNVWWCKQKRWKNNSNKEKKKENFFVRKDPDVFMQDQFQVSLWWSYQLTQHYLSSYSIKLFYFFIYFLPRIHLIQLSLLIPTSCCPSSLSNPWVSLSLSFLWKALFLPLYFLWTHI